MSRNTMKMKPSTRMLESRAKRAILLTGCAALVLPFSPLAAQERTAHPGSDAVPPAEIAYGGPVEQTGPVIDPPAPSRTGAPVPDSDHSRRRGKVADDSAVMRRVTIEPNVEQETRPQQGKIPFAISVDGVELVDGKSEVSKDRPQSPDDQRKTDVGLSGVDIQVKFDGLNAKPILNVMTDPVRSVYRAGETINFFATANYPAYIQRAEVRIFRAGDPVSNKPVAIVEIPVNGSATWVMPEAERDNDESGFYFVLRVYDEKGRYDETLPRGLERTSRDVLPDETDHEEAAAPGMLEDNTGVRNIPIRGGAVTVYGRDVPEGHHVRVLGDEIPVDMNQAFLVQRILRPGTQEIDVALTQDGSDSVLAFTREITIPQDDWFYVALGDLTLGKNSGDKGIQEVRPGEYENVYTRGRLAFYVKGKIKGRYLLTAAGDTGDGPVGDMFKGLDAKDPRRLLRRVDPDQYYPVYGDDSTAYADAPTNGKFYVRLERGDSMVLWGNYKTVIHGTEFMRSERALYGANLVYRSEDATSFGERNTEVTAYAAQPDTLPQRDEFLGTGGSAYFLKRQDITVGSETVTVEVRDETTGIPIERRMMRYGEDYSIDYLQGVVILRRPLQSSTVVDGAVREGALGGNRVFLIAQYEYTPTAGQLDGYSFGGRAQQWIGDKVRIGVTGMNEDTGPSDQRALGADVQIRHSERTYIEGEIAHSKGPGFGTSRSYDGGLTLSDVQTAGSRDLSALAWRAKGQIDLEDITKSGVKGTAGFYVQEREAGFSTLSDQIFANQTIWGANADLDLTGGYGVRLIYDDFDEGPAYRDIAGPFVGGRQKRKGTFEISKEFPDRLKLILGTSYLEIDNPMATAAGKANYDGSRVDVGIRLEHRPDDDHRYWIFGQTTIDRAGNINHADRVGIGARQPIVPKITIDGEISYGSTGLGTLAAITYEPKPETSYSFGYRLDPDRAYDLDRTYDLSGADRGTIVLGARRKFDERWSAHAENNYDLFGKRTSLTKTYGIAYTPSKYWTIDGGFEAGRIQDDTVDPSSGIERPDFDRQAFSLSVGYKDEDRVVARVRGEARFEDSDDNTRDMNTYLLAAGLSLKTSDDWRMLLNVDSVFTDSSSEASFRNGSYAEATLGFAYRPVYHNRLNALFRYTFLFDRPGVSQVSAVTGEEYGPAQRSHILSADFIYDLAPWLSLGAKYGMRMGEVRYRVEDDRQQFDDWQKSSAHLGIIRADFHVVKRWDALLEARVMRMPEADTTDLGFLAGIYRHVGNNMKIGVGYNFGRFSDDLRDLTLNDRGFFFNIIGKF